MLRRLSMSEAISTSGVREWRDRQEMGQLPSFLGWTSVAAMQQVQQAWLSFARRSGRKVQFTSRRAEGKARWIVQKYSQLPKIDRARERMRVRVRRDRDSAPGGVVQQRCRCVRFRRPGT